jgi:DNA polymerase IIIc chi subunit
MQVTIHGPNLNDQSKGTFHVHTAACRDNRKEVVYNGSELPWTIEAASVIEVVEAVYADQMAEHQPGEKWADPENYVSDFHFAPCTAALPHE